MVKAAALLIGINYTQTPTLHLNGCWNDAIGLCSYLASPSLGIPHDNIDVVIDNTTEGMQRTTKKEIIKSILDLVTKSWVEELDYILFSFSGHGSQARDTNGDEADGMDEGICPSDVYKTDLILDDDLIKLFNQVNPNTKVYCIFDCCHSGTMLDLPYEYPEIGKPGKSNQPNQSNQHIVMISGCTDPQCSADAYNEKSQSYGGALTMSLLEQLVQNQDICVLELHARVLTSLRRRGFTQFPVISSTKEINKCLKFLPIM
jgi:hypothetical protein